MLAHPQMGEMGLTQDVGEEGLRFEVWVRQAARTKDCITLQARDREGKVAWTHDVAHLLWTHAINNTGNSTDGTGTVDMGTGSKTGTDSMYTDNMGTGSNLGTGNMGTDNNWGTLIEFSCHPSVSSACPQRYYQIFAGFS